MISGTAWDAELEEPSSPPNHYLNLNTYDGGIKYEIL